MDGEEGKVERIRAQEEEIGVGENLIRYLI